MPGTRLNDTERDLLKWWRKSEGYTYPVLRSLSIEGAPGLRGIQDLTLDFDYPLTVICGRNGCGKTTALALAVLGFHSPAGHIPINAQRRPKRGHHTTYYTFRDFFFKGPSDPDITGVKIAWKYEGAKDTVIHKRGEKWMHYERRPKRPVHYLGVIRSIPAIEQTTLRARFKADAKSSDSWTLNDDYLNDDYRKRLTDIMRRAYDEAGVMAADGYFLRRARAGDTYSSFNMGAGEDVLIDLLLVLQQCPKGSMIVIEEVELGLHPEAQVRFARHLQEIILKKKLQVIVSTHSQYFLDSVPREARILIRRDGTEHSVIRKPATKFAVGDMTGTPDPELDVYCEDNVAELLIRESLPGPVRKRVRILPVGSDAELAAQGSFHLRTRLGKESDVLLAWDGDVGKSDIDRFLTKAGLTEETPGKANSCRANWMTLPGDTAPERWILQVLDCSDGHELLGNELGETKAGAAGIVERLRTSPDHHDIAFELGSMYGFSPQQALSCLVRAVSRLPSRPLGPVCEVVQAVLDGQRVCGAPDAS